MIINVIIAFALYMTTFLQAEKLTSSIKSSSFYGFTKQTLNSLMLAILPPADYKYEPQEPTSGFDEEPPQDMTLYLLKTLVEALKSNAGFRLPTVSQ